MQPQICSNSNCMKLDVSVPLVLACWDSLSCLVFSEERKVADKFNPKSLKDSLCLQECCWKILVNIVCKMSCGTSPNHHPTTTMPLCGVR